MNLQTCAAAAMAVAACLSMTSNLFAQCRNSPPKFKIEIEIEADQDEYGPWQISRSGNYWRHYYVHVGGVLKRHYVIWFPERPDVCYCYNPMKQVYWGRWNGYGPEATFTRAIRKSETVRETTFSREEVVVPVAPGTNVPMTPPDLPPDV